MSDKNKIDQSPQEDKQNVKNFQININEFGEVRSNLGIEKLNEFLDENLADKKLKDRDGAGEEE